LGKFSTLVEIEIKMLTPVAPFAGITELTEGDTGACPVMPVNTFLKQQ
jgi:hypothetical protein